MREHGKRERDQMTERKLSLYIVPTYKGKGSRSECTSCRGISLMCVPGKVYGRILTERLMEVTEGKMSEEQGDFRKERGCVD